MTKFILFFLAMAATLAGPALASEIKAVRVARALK